MEALHRAIADACLGAHADDELAPDLRGFFEERGALPEDVDAILAAPRTLLVYRSLVRNGLSSVVLRILPRTRARLNAARPERFGMDLSSFLDQESPRTHYLRDVPAEFFAWAEPRWRSDPEVPAYLADFAAFELAQFAVGTSESATAVDFVEDVTLDRPLAFVDSARIARYAWAVHELSRAEDATDVPLRRDVHLLAYRDPAHAVQWLELSPIASTILGLLLSGETLGAAVQRASASLRAKLDGELADFARLLADLGSRGVLFGARGRRLPPNLPDPP